MTAAKAAWPALAMRMCPRDIREPSVIQAPEARGFDEAEGACRSVATFVRLCCHARMELRTDSRTDDLVRRVSAHFGRAAATARPVAGGYSRARRLVVHWREGGSVFVKAATDADTTAWLRAERTIYERYRGPFIPELLGWQDD